MVRVVPARTTLIASLVATVVAALAACGSEPAADRPDADPGPDTTGEIFEVTLGPVNVPAGGENTQCVEKRLGNAEAKWIGKLHSQLEGVSHHLIVYKVNSTVERPEPFDCTPFLETLDPDVGQPLMVSQIKEETLDLPFGVAFGVEAGQMVRLEMHFVNAGDAPATVSAKVGFEVLPEAQFRHEAGFLFVGNPDIDIPAGATQTLGPSWFELPQDFAGISVFGMTGHTHQWGTDVYVEWAPWEGDPATPLYDYDGWDWEEPPMARFSPPVTMPSGSGFNFSCSYSNQSNQAVGFGESASDEMCFFWAYYYPSKGHKVCVHTQRLGPPIDICCPSSDSLCDEVLDYLKNNF